MLSRFEYLNKNLRLMAEFALEQVMLQADAMENDDHDLAIRVITRDDELDKLEKENDNLSQNAILEAAANQQAVNEERPKGYAPEPLRFALSAIRLTRYFERIGDQVVDSLSAFQNGNIRKGFFKEDETASLILARVVTIVGMAVESLVEEKDRFYGSVQKVEKELDYHCMSLFRSAVDDARFSRREFADLFRILISIERQGDLAENVAMELVRLQTGRDIRHLFPGSPAFRTDDSPP